MVMHEPPSTIYQYVDDQTSSNDLSLVVDLPMMSIETICWRTSLTLHLSQRGKPEATSPGKRLALMSPKTPSYNDMNVPELRKECKGRRLKTGGLREELITKLMKDDKGRTTITYLSFISPSKRTREGQLIVPNKVISDKLTNVNDKEEIEERGGSPTLHSRAEVEVATPNQIPEPHNDNDISTDSPMISEISTLESTNKGSNLGKGEDNNSEDRGQVPGEELHVYQHHNQGPKFQRQGEG